MSSSNPAKARQGKSSQLAHTTHGKKKPRHITPEPMGMILRRQNELMEEVEFRASLGVPQYVPPPLTAKRVQGIVSAAKEHAEADPSDPFAYRRSLTHMVRGLADYNEVGKDARHVLRVREYARTHKAQQDVLPEGHGVEVAKAA